MNKADELIACLEGEIAKRDARIAELEARYQRDVYGLNNEGDPIGGDPAGGYANDNARLRTELAAIKAQEPVAIEFRQFMTAVVTGAGLLSCGKQSKGLAAELSATAYKYLLAAPVSEAKAQGVVMPEKIQQALDFSRNFADSKPDIGITERQHILGLANLLEKVARLNATPVQQVSVPDVSAMARILADRNADACNVNREDNWAIHGQDYIDDVYRAMIAATPAAPAADAGLVEALDLAANRLDRLALEHDEFWRGYATAWADEARATANGVKS